MIDQVSALKTFLHSLGQEQTPNQRLSPCHTGQLSYLKICEAEKPFVPSEELLACIHDVAVHLQRPRAVDFADAFELSKELRHLNLSIIARRAWSPMELKEDTPEDHRRRSDFIKKLVQSPSRGRPLPPEYSSGVPRTIVQFWHKRAQLPSDVSDCMKSWKSLETHGFKYLFFDQEDAMQFISERLGERHIRAFEKCYHPAMQSDYFRLCYISVEGGFYVDADDVYLGSTIDNLFIDGRLKIQPLCYDIKTGLMVEPAAFTSEGAYSPSWIFYFNNNPLIAPPHHTIIDRALAQSTLLLERSTGELPEIQSTTGPGNLSKSIFELDTDRTEIESSLYILSNWESAASTKWQLSYRHDSRNWRLSNQKQHQG